MSVANDNDPLMAPEAYLDLQRQQALAMHGEDLLAALKAARLFILHPSSAYIDKGMSRLSYEIPDIHFANLVKTIDEAVAHIEPQSSHLIA